VTVSITAPAAGTYQGTISISSDGTTNSPLSIPVALTVTSQGGQTFEGAVAAFVDAMAAKQQSCSKVSSYYIAMFRSSLNAHYAGMAAAVAAGRASFSQAEADRCVAALNAATCTQLETGSAGLSSCGNWVRGLVENGSACYAGAECASGWCKEDAACPGVCTAFTAHGASCSKGSDECGPGYLCEGSWMSATCVPETIGAAAGDPCGSSGCAAELFCNNGICANRGARDAACGASGECQPGLACDFGSRTCKPVVGVDQSCPAALCGMGLYCRASDSICREQALAGDDCTDPDSTFGVHCIDGSFCLGTTTKRCTNGTAATSATCEPSPTETTPASRICGPQADCIGSVCVAELTPPPSACY
jgi:hypothetical protein